MMEDAASGVPSSDELAAGAEAAAFNAAENVDGGVRRAALILFAANGEAGLVRTAAGGFGGDGAVRSSSRGDVGEPGGGRACKKKRTAEVRCLETVLVFICRGEADGSSRSSFLKVGELTGRASLSKCDESATPS